MCFAGARLVTLHELERLRSEYDELGRKLEEYERTVGSIDRARGLLHEAQQVGLLGDREMPTQRADIDMLLSRAVSRPTSLDYSLILLAKGKRML